MRLAFLLLPSIALAADTQIQTSLTDVPLFEHTEITLTRREPLKGNPFVDANLRATLTLPDGKVETADGFCDSEDGTVFRLRFMPRTVGEHRWALRFQDGTEVEERGGSFRAIASKTPGMVVVDPVHPWHFMRSGSGEPFLYNSTTTYFLLGWQDEGVIRESIDRLHGLGINRIRVSLSGRTEGGPRWFEPLIMSTPAFQYRLEPWPAARPASITDPGYDVKRFNLHHFRKTERMLAHAMKHDMAVSLIFQLDGKDAGVDPFGKAGAGGEDERRYYRYVIARLAAYANVMWDVTNEWHLFRGEAWVNETGSFIKACDPYDHATTVHGKGEFPFRKSAWCDFAEYQSWDEHGAYDFMLKNRREQAATGRPMPQVNEEYGYEDHYPVKWGDGRRWPLRIGETRRKYAWQMMMAGGYQTTGERANVAGHGGWINGRGDDSMTMLKGYAMLRTFVESLPWRTLNPMPELVKPMAEGAPAHLLADPGRCYVLYFPQGRTAEVTLERGRYKVRRYHPRTGEWTSLPAIEAASYTNAEFPDLEDWALVIERE